MTKIPAVTVLAMVCVGGWAALQAPGAIGAQTAVADGAENTAFANPSAVARVRIRAAPSKAFAAFADGEQMSKFWFTRRDEGLTAGEPSTWYIGSSDDAYSFDVRVIEVSPPRSIVIEWENGGEYTQVRWSFDETGDGQTILTIEETGFTGGTESIVERVVDSTGGFNQVIIAAKAWIEHGIRLHVVDDHA